MKWKFRKSDSKISLTQKRWSELRYPQNIFTTKMDPESEALKYPEPVRIVAPRNRYVDVKYTGNETDADNIIPIATLQRDDNAMYKLFDCGMLPLEFSYLGLGIDADSRNNAYNKMFANLMIQSLSAAFATQLTELAFLNCKYQTDIPEMSVAGSQEANVGALVWYQSVVQAPAGIIAKWNTLQSLRDYLVDMGYAAEAPYTIELINLFQKREFFSLLEQLATVVKQDYFDIDYYKEVTVLNGTVSRISDDPQNPLLTICGVTHIPNIEIKDSGGSNVLFSTMTAGKPGYSYFNNIQVTVNGATMTFARFQDLVYHIENMMDPENILAHARQLASGAQVMNTTAYINEVIACIQACLATLNVFKNYTVDIRTFLMVLQDRTDLNKWTLDVPFRNPKYPRAQVKPAAFGILMDIFKAFGTCGDLVYDGNTRKWHAYTNWRESIGIPAYELQEGGFSIAAAVRNIPVDASGYAASQYMFPRLFRRLKIGNNVQYQYFVNRRGYQFMMNETLLNAQNIKASSYFARLNSLDSADVTIKVPLVTQSSLTSDTVLMSCINKLLMRVFGIGRGVYGTGQNQIINDNVDSDVVCVVGREFSDFSSSALEYLATRIPIRQVDGTASIGFETVARPVGRS